MKSLSAMSLTGLAHWGGLLLFCLLLTSAAPFAAAESQQAGQMPAGVSAASPSVDASQASLDEAIKEAKKKLAASPSSVQGLVKLGNLLLKRGSLEEAEKAFDGALALNGLDHDALTGKGIVLARMGKDQEAEETLGRALVLNPNPVRTYYELGSLYEKEGDFAKAIIEFKKGIEKFKQGRK